MVDPPGEDRMTVLPSLSLPAPFFFLEYPEQPHPVVVVVVPTTQCTGHLAAVRGTVVGGGAILFVVVLIGCFFFWIGKASQRESVISFWFRIFYKGLFRAMVPFVAIAQMVWKVLEAIYMIFIGISQILRAIAQMVGELQQAIKLAFWPLWYPSWYTFRFLFLFETNWDLYEDPCVRSREAKIWSEMALAVLNALLQILVQRLRHLLFITVPGWKRWWYCYGAIWQYGGVVTVLTWFECRLFSLPPTTRTPREPARAREEPRTPFPLSPTTLRPPPPPPPNTTNRFSSWDSSIVGLDLIGFQVTSSQGKKIGIVWTTYFLIKKWIRRLFFTASGWTFLGLVLFPQAPHGINFYQRRGMVG